MKNIIKLASILGLLGLIGGYFISKQTIRDTIISVPDEGTLTVVLTIQAGLTAFILGIIGLVLQKKTQLQLIKTDKLKTGFILSVLFGLVSGFIIQASDAWFFSDKLKEVKEYEPEMSFDGLVGGMFYGGIVEEVAMRLFVMTIAVLLLGKLFKTKEASNSVYWISIIISSSLFAIGHLPANALVFGELTPLIVIRTLVLNGIGGIFFGYLYWKYGFWFSVISHMVAHIGMQLLYIPLLF